MAKVAARELPPQALLLRYTARGDYTDCFGTEVPAVVSHADFVAAFYTTPVFRLERLILRLAVARPSTDSEARELAAGSAGEFAAWRVEERAENQLLLSDFRGHTRSWLMVAHDEQPAGPRTRLFFGSAIVAVADPASGARRIRPGYRALLGFHRLYSRILLGAARRRLASQSGHEQAD